LQKRSSFKVGAKEAVVPEEISDTKKKPLLCIGAKGKMP
jgi:hypothetical protein